MKQLNGPHPGFKKVKKLAGTHPGYKQIDGPTKSKPAVKNKMMDMPTPPKQSLFNAMIKAKR